MKIAILGGGGCFALSFARYLFVSGIDCFGVMRSPVKKEPLWLAPPVYRTYVKHLGEQLDEAMQVLDYEKPDIVVNFAAQGEGAASFGANSPLFYQTNCVALVRLVEELRKRLYLDRFIHISTSELYGSCDHPIAESGPVRASSPYSISKAAFDAHLEVMYRVHKFPMQIIRPSNCYVPGQQLHRIIPRAMISAVYREKLQLQGGGEARKSYLYADDLSAAIMRVLEVGNIGQTYNVGPDDPIRIRDLVHAVAEVSGVPWMHFVEEVSARTGEDACYWLDSSKIKRLGWKQSISLEEGLSNMLEWVTHFTELRLMPKEFVMRP